MSLINGLKGGDWQTPEYSSYFCRISKAKGKVIRFTVSQLDDSASYMLLILLLFPLCSVIWMLLYLFKKKKGAIIPFYSCLSFSSPSSVQKVSPNTLLDSSKHTRSSFTRRQLLPIFLAFHWWTIYTVLLSPKISHFLPGKATIHTKNTAHISQKAGSLRDLCIQLYFQLIGTPASSTTPNTVLPG